MRIFIVTGTSTGVGKTVATAALMSLVAAAGKRVAMIKPVQTGTTGPEPSDAATVARLSGFSTVAELSTLEDPLAPDSAARLRHLDIASVEELAAQALERCAAYDVMLVEGAGGVLVRLDTAGGTLIQLAQSMISQGHSVRFVIVTGLTLGTLNHTELTVNTLRQHGQEIAGLVIGSVPEQVDLAAERNLLDLPRVTQLPILAEIPAGAGALSPASFQEEALGWFCDGASDYFTGTPTAAGSTGAS